MHAPQPRAATLHSPTSPTMLNRGFVLVLALCLSGWTLPASCCDVPRKGARKGAHARDKMFNDRPIIGVMSQPGNPAPEGYSYIAASYVKWAEAAGARVIPILYDLTEDELRHRFSIINGLLLPGGGANLRPGHLFYDTAQLMVDLALDANRNGDYFPVQGTCLGLETLTEVISQNYSILSNFDAEDAAASLLYTKDADDSHFIRSLPEDVQQGLQYSDIAMENHARGLSMAAYLENPPLSDFFKVVSLSLDKSGYAYVSTMEARKYPIVATQWHPEKNAYEWTPTLDIPHTPEAIRMAQEVANFFINETRRNMHKANSQIEEDDLVIYNYNATFTGRHVTEGEERDFDQAYFFKAEKNSRTAKARRRTHAAAVRARHVGAAPPARVSHDEPGGGD